MLLCCARTVVEALSRQWWWSAVFSASGMNYPPRLRPLGFVLLLRDQVF